ncbi:T9SS type A sorting domain-containing protein [Flaviaesturariibacter amylovorans]|uniref:Exo-alpha-sialidase n=1 Tax=Flaviaesturariibacter amylovorans TaxID=1084520 RepID=A0ABP8GDL7_9BACT
MKSLFRSGTAVALCLALFSCTPGGRTPEAEEEAAERLEADGMELAVRQQFRATRDLSLNDVPTQRLLQAQQVRDLMIATGRTAAISWQERGPTNIGGRSRAVLVDRRDATGNTVFASSVSGGIFKTTNFNSTPVTWAPVNDKMTNLAITAMWQSRTNPDVMYAGTGEGWFNIDAVRGAGIFKSTDGGNTWNQIPSTATFEYVQDLVSDNNDNLYVSLRNNSSDKRGVQRSTDGGNTWTQVLGAPLGTFTTGRAADLEVASNGDVYATLGIFPDAGVAVSVWKSAATNGANTGTAGTWTEVTPPGLAAMYRAELAIAPSNPQRLYLALANQSDAQVSTIYRSDNGGTTWTATGVPTGMNNGANSQGWYNLILAVDPTNPDILVGGGLHLTRSLNGGSSWTTISSSSVTGTHVDQHELIYVSNSRLIVGNDGGIYVSDNMNATTPTFANKNNGFNVTQFYGADFHPTIPNFFLAGAQDNNTLRFTNAGLSTATPVIGGDGGVPHIDQNDGNLQIGAYVYNNYYRSLNGGTSFSNIASANTGQFINPSDFDDAANVLYAGEDAGKFFRITDVGGTPATASPRLNIIGNREVTAVRVDHSAANTVWFGTSFASLQPMIVKATNANAAAVASVSTTLTAVPANANVSSIEIDPANANRIIVTLSNYGIISVLQSTDGGATFNSIEGNLPDMPVYWSCVVPANIELNGPGNGAGGILLGTETGVWYATNVNGTSTNWQPYANFPNVRTDMVKYRASDRTVLVATHGRGLWTAVLTQATGTSNVTATRDFIKYVSAANNRLTIAAGNATTRRMTVEVFDTRGALLHRETRAYGNATLPLSAWSHGAYIVRITGDKKEVYVKQIVK